MKWEASKKYVTTLIVAAIVLLTIALVGLFFRLRDGVNLWIFSYIPFVGSAALLLSLPVSLVWLIVGAKKKRHAAVRHMALALVIPIVSLAVAAAAAWRIMRELFPA